VLSREIERSPARRPERLERKLYARLHAQYHRGIERILRRRSGMHEAAGALALSLDRFAKLHEDLDDRRSRVVPLRRDRAEIRAEPACRRFDRVSGIRRDDPERRLGASERSLEADDCGDERGARQVLVAHRAGQDRRGERRHIKSKKTVSPSPCSRMDHSSARRPVSAFEGTSVARRSTGTCASSGRARRSSAVAVA
jgi:hypothetical protein